MGKSYTKRKRNNKYRKTIKINRKKNKKGGLLWNSNVKVAGIDLSKKSGQKEYNWKTGKWDDLVCYGIGPLKGCKTVPAK